MTYIFSLYSCADPRSRLKPLAGASVLIFVNKIDTDGCMDDHEIEEVPNPTPRMQGLSQTPNSEAEA